MNLEVNGKRLKLHYLTVVGSTLHGLNSPDSDVDVKGVFTWKQEDYLGLEEPLEVLDNKNMSKEDRFELMQQLEERFMRKFDDDLDLLEAKKFFKMAQKSDPTMLDMLYSSKVSDGSMVLFCSPEFKDVLNNRDLFLNYELSKKRFLGMSFNCLKLGRKEANKNRFKDLAKSLQTLFSFKNLVEEREFHPRLNTNQHKEVLDVKNNHLELDFHSFVKMVERRRSLLEEECNQLDLPLESKTQKEKNKSLNASLLNLRHS